ncbi:MAG: hypothetical protein H9W81_13480 [Enterococcus sp.]|nr:hypothetical protein [Enterococcus sp.]
MTIPNHLNDENTIPVTIYGASDDLVELDTPDWSIYEEYDAYGPTFVRLTAPDGKTMVIRVEFGREGSKFDWDLEIYENSTTWVVEDSVRPDRDSDPALIIHAPVGTYSEEVTSEYE